MSMDIYINKTTRRLVNSTGGRLAFSELPTFVYGDSPLSVSITLRDASGVVAPTSGKAYDLYIDVDKDFADKDNVMCHASGTISGNSIGFSLVTRTERSREVATGRGRNISVYIMLEETSSSVADGTVSAILLNDVAMFEAVPYDGTGEPAKPAINYYTAAQMDALVARIEGLQTVPEPSVDGKTLLTSDGEYVLADPGGGTSDYITLSNKPQINSVELTGNKTAAQLSLASASDLTDHTNNTTIHVTTGDKTAWNAKADASDLTDHTGDTTIHVTTGDKTAWNAKADASALTDHTGNATIHVTTGDKTAWNAKADASTTLAGYGIADAYTKAQVDAKTYDRIVDGQCEIDADGAVKRPGAWTMSAFSKDDSKVTFAGEGETATPAPYYDWTERMWVLAPAGTFEIDYDDGGYSISGANCAKAYSLESPAVTTVHFIMDKDPAGTGTVVIGTASGAASSSDSGTLPVLPDGFADSIPQGSLLQMGADGKLAAAVSSATAVTGQYVRKTATGYETAEVDVPGAIATHNAASDAHAVQFAGYVKKYSGSGAPTAATVGAVGDRYLNAANQKTYTCTAVADGTYTWVDDINARGGTLLSDAGLTFSQSNNAGLLLLANNPWFQGFRIGRTSSNHYYLHIGNGDDAQKSIAAGQSTYCNHGSVALFGFELRSTRECQLQCGQYAYADGNTIFACGNGRYGTSSSAFRVQQNGDIIAPGALDCTTYRKSVTDTASTSITLATAANNTTYRYGTLTSLAISAIADSDLETIVIFQSGSTACSVTLPSSINTSLMDAPAANKRYVLSIANGVAVGCNFNLGTITVTTPVAISGAPETAITSVTLSATASTGGTVTFALASGSSLPAGISMTSGGVISGTPTTAGSTTANVLASCDGCVSETIVVNFTIASSTPTIYASYDGGGAAEFAVASFTVLDKPIWVPAAFVSEITESNYTEYPNIRAYSTGIWRYYTAYGHDFADLNSSSDDYPAAGTYTSDSGYTLTITHA